MLCPKFIRINLTLRQFWFTVICNPVNCITVYGAGVVIPALPAAFMAAMQQGINAAQPQLALQAPAQQAVPQQAVPMVQQQAVPVVPQQAPQPMIINVDEPPADGGVFDDDAQALADATAALGGLGI